MRSIPRSEWTILLYFLVSKRPFSTGMTGEGWSSDQLPISNDMKTNSVKCSAIARFVAIFYVKNIK